METAGFEMMLAALRGWMDNNLELKFDVVFQGPEKGASVAPDDIYIEKAAQQSSSLGRLIHVSLNSRIAKGWLHYIDKHPIGLRNRCLLCHWSQVDRLRTNRSNCWTLIFLLRPNTLTQLGDTVYLP